MKVNRHDTEKPKLHLSSKEENPPDLVKLSLFEFIHIRTQETKADLDAFVGNGKEDLKQGKLCFCCKSVQFRLMRWGYECRICKHNVRLHFHIL